MKIRRELRYPSVPSALGLLLSGLLVSTGVSAATSYLQELEAEAAATDNATQSTEPAATQSWQNQQTTAGEKLDPGLSKAMFEESLKNRFYGSYLFYSNLNDKKQQVVYEEYKKNNDIDHLREVIKTQMTN